MKKFLIHIFFDIKNRKIKNNPQKIPCKNHKSTIKVEFAFIHWNGESNQWLFTEEKTHFLQKKMPSSVMKGTVVCCDEQSVHFELIRLFAIQNDPTILKVKKMMEFYFGDKNLPKDKYLLDHLDKHGFATLELLGSFGGVKRIFGKEKDVRIDALADAVRFSAFLVLSEDGKRVRRKGPMPKKQSNCDLCTVSFTKLPANIDEKEIREMSEKFGKIKRLSKENDRFLVEYFTEKEASKAVRELGGDWRSFHVMKFKRRTRSRQFSIELNEGEHLTKGVVTSSNGKYGFIQAHLADGGKRKVFFHWHEVSTDVILKVGHEVQFVLVEDPTSENAQATNVHLVPRDRRSFSQRPRKNSIIKTGGNGRKDSKINGGSNNTNNTNNNNNQNNNNNRNRKNSLNGNGNRRRGNRRQSNGSFDKTGSVDYTNFNTRRKSRTSFGNFGNFGNNNSSNNKNSASRSMFGNHGDSNTTSMNAFSNLGKGSPAKGSKMSVDFTPPSLASSIGGNGNRPRFFSTVERTRRRRNSSFCVRQAVGPDGSKGFGGKGRGRESFSLLRRLSNVTEKPVGSVGGVLKTDK
eukprot:TRINITY_DN545_c0_g1_i1.p1 TRINITY_DN545_c0_g1~~TRINITY_DN545_c0_g1_i1.p1  ORF type:complete len:574 (-),score=156.67 TRINITY_DN545_c0_g1_i1:506-2227(-)